VLNEKSDRLKEKSRMSQRLPADQWLLSSVRFAAAVTVSGRQNDGIKQKVNKAMIEEARGRIATMAT
jgi:hypothetical protein